MRALEKAILNRPTTPEGHFVKGSVVKSQYQYETHRNLEILKHNGKKKTIIHASNFPKVELDLDFLPAAAESYHISPNPEDYILVSLPIVSADIPNRNLQCFPLCEISHFDPLYGCMVYETFKRKATFTDHCFAAGTKVRTSEHTSKNIEDINEGDEVITHKNQIKKVTKKFINGVKPVTKLIVTGCLEEMYVTENHPIYIVDNRQIFGRTDLSTRRNKSLRHSNFRALTYKPHWRPVSDIYCGDYACIPINYGGDIATNPNLAFIVGTFLADGSYAKNDKYPEGYGITLTVGSHKKEVITKLKDAFSALGLPCQHYPEKTEGTDWIQCNNVEITKQIRSWCGEYSHAKHMQGDLRKWDKESTKVLLGAYISGDGCFDKKKKAYRIRSSSLELLRDIQQAFAFIDIPVCIGVDEKVGVAANRNKKPLKSGQTIVPKHDSGYARIPANFAISIKDYVVGKDFECKSTEKDTVKLIIQENYILSPIRIIQRDICTAEVFNLEVDDDHTYIANDIIVHNCNQDPTEAKGIHVDASMQYIPKYDLWKIVVLTMWDRTKDEQLVKDILNKKRNAYSMGATVNNFICSVCGKIDNLDAHSCEHMRPPGGIWGEKKRLAAQLCTGVCYFETSNLGNEPADPTAYSEDIYV